MSASFRRLFVGLVLPDEVASRLVGRVHPILEDEEGVRLHSASELHLTLAFLGEFPEAQRPRLEGALREELRGLNAPELTLSDTGAFPGRNSPRVLWAGVEEGAETAGRLHALHNRVLQAALSLRWRPPSAERHRPFRPHVTLARMRTGEPHRAFFEQQFDHPWLPVEVSLIESCPDRPDERYRPLWAVPLVVRPG